MATCPGRTEWRERLGLLIDAMDRSVEALGPEPPAWCGRGQPMQLTMATVAEHVAVQEDIAMTAVAEHVAVEKVIASMAAEPAGDEPRQLAMVLAMRLAMVLVTTSQLSPVQSGARRTCRLR